MIAIALLVAIAGAAVLVWFAWPDLPDYKQRGGL